MRTDLGIGAYVDRAKRSTVRTEVSAVCDHWTVEIVVPIADSDTLA